jgi:hypothetical protein
MASNEGNLLLAASAIKRGQIQSIKRAAKVYGVSDNTLRRRIKGTQSRQDCTANSRKLTVGQEEVLTRHLIDLDLRGFGPKLHEVAAMANHILTTGGGGKVGSKWPYNYIKRTPELKMRFSRKYAYERAKCEDPAVIKPWFELVYNTISKYGITTDDIYNFDETGFQMGAIATCKVVTGSERRNAPKVIQPGNREWVTVIQGVGAQGWVLPPFIIFAGTYHLAAWYQEDLPKDTVIALSDSGWTTNELGLRWLQHFDQHTKDRTKGTHRLLILDGHESHESLDFKLYCENHQIITICMPPHSSHLLQPLDVGCFSPLKKAYGDQIQHLMRTYIHHITKLEFLPTFNKAFNQAITPSNIQGGFRGAGLLPLDPEAVLSKLDIRLKTPTPPPIESIITTPWQSKTPSNAFEISLQSDLIRNQIQQHQDSSPTLMLESLDRLAKGAQSVATYATLIKAQVADLEAANQALAARKKRSKQKIQKQGILTQAAGKALINQNEVNNQIEQEIQQARRLGGGGARAQYCCSGCGERGHRINQCSQR